MAFKKNLQYYKFCAYGFFKNLRFFEPFYILFLLSRGLTFLEIGSLYTIREILKNVFEIPAGVLADALGRRKVMLVSFGFYIVSFLWYYFSESYWGFAAAVALFAFGDAFRSGTHKAMILQYLKIQGWEKEKIHYYGHTRSWSQAGSAFSALIAAAIIFYTGDYEFIFLFSIIPYLFDLIILYSYPRIFDNNSKGIDIKQFRQQFADVVRDFLISFRQWKLLQAILNLSVYTGYYKAVRDYLQPLIKSMAALIPVAFLSHLEVEKKSAIVLGLVYFVLYMITSRASRSSGKLAKKFPTVVLPLNATILIGLCAGILSGLFYIYGWMLASVLLYMMIIILENIRKPMGVSYVSDQLEKDIMATALSASSQTESLIAAVLAPLMGFIADQYGPGMAILSVSILMLLFSPVFLARKKEARK